MTSIHTHEAGTTEPDDGPHFVTLPDGRRLAYAEYGAASGHPVLYCHGFPSSRREARLMHADAVAAGARIIAPDRPGYGDSDHAPGRRLADWADDCAALVGALGLSHFAIVGVSGGGPYALACACHLPARLPPARAGALAACTLVCPLGPIHHARLTRQMNPAARASLRVGRWPGWVADLIYGAPTTAVLARWPQLVEKFRHIAAPAADRAVLRAGDTAAILNRTIADAMRNGALGARRDLWLYTHDWGLELGQIHRPIRIWHGEADGTVPVSHARWLAAHLPDTSLTLLPGEGHYSVPIGFARRILTELTDVLRVQPE
ncbi:alpha/beta hydrolase [uncultured Thiohalocapsa sp.]|uniref:alpha/beta fold hydrolase n=1 Tax=uncultured Thiohalocapsa sp. TaxID=768990 RepID=UPI0025E7C6A1|nr:alpha/beta hydrolase [uncultured Thiohalocapsa sp.]